jgi:CheY-like chemotaxis protein
MARILVIDDEELIRRLLIATLKSQGHEVLDACDGAEGLRLLQVNHPDLIITDIIMPEMDGVELLMTLRREAPNIRVIAMSGGGQFGHHATLELAEPLGAFATLHKPFAPEAVLSLVKEALAA